MPGVDILSVAEVEARLVVEHDGIGIAHVVVELVQIGRIARQTVHFGHDGHHHVERVGPPPVVVGGRPHLVAHDLAGALHHAFVAGRRSLGVGHPVEVDVSLETDLPVAEEHVLLVFAILAVFPLRGVGFAGPLPQVVLGPARAVVLPGGLSQQLASLHVARMVHGFVPEAAHFGLVVLLPMVVYAGDEGGHLLSGPVPGL